MCAAEIWLQAVGMYNIFITWNWSRACYRVPERLSVKRKASLQSDGVYSSARHPRNIKKKEPISRSFPYGSVLRIIQEAANVLENHGISCEIIDVQTLLPFDINHKILESLKKNKPHRIHRWRCARGAAGFMFNKVMEEQGGYRYLDVSPRTITGKAHRPRYGSDGDYFGKPNAEEIQSVISANDERIKEGEWYREVLKLPALLASFRVSPKL